MKCIKAETNMYLENQAKISSRILLPFFTASKVVTFELKVAIENAKGRKLPCK